MKLSNLQTWPFESPLKPKTKTFKKKCSFITTITTPKYLWAHQWHLTKKKSKTQWTGSNFPLFFSKTKTLGLKFKIYENENLFKIQTLKDQVEKSKFLDLKTDHHLLKSKVFDKESLHFEVEFQKKKETLRLRKLK